MDNKEVILTPRIKLIAAFFLLTHLLILFNFFKIQVIDHNFYKKRQERYVKRDQIVWAKRGNILTSNDAILAYSDFSESIYITPSIIRNRRDKEKIATKLGEILNVNTEFILGLINKKTDFAWVKRQQFPKGFFDKNLRSLGLPGVGYRLEKKRYHNNAKIGSHIVGFVGIDHHGLASIEFEFNDLLREIHGRREYYVNAVGKELKRGSGIVKQPIDGKDVKLTIDLSLQTDANRCLYEIDSTYKLIEGCVIILNGFSGKILSMESYPTFDRNLFNHEKHSIIDRNVGIHRVILASPIVDFWRAALSREHFGRLNFSNSVLSGRRISFSEFDNESIKQLNVFL